ncbi:MAG: plastocyanin/azurin family copper-binding protein [Thermoproteota archaeon]|nr:plastocyanin/azurin family copper-binding protein [Thermoproteota archaeon]
MLSKNNNKAVLATLALMLLSLSVASSIAISIPHYASAQGVTGQGGGNATNATMMGGAGNATNASTTTTTGASGGGGNTTATSVSIVPGSSTLTTDAFSPNPIQVSVGTTVTWTNNDAQPHTVNSGENATPSGLFNSPIMAPAATFEYTFTEAGDVPYYCMLHPNMVGTVSVS